jgi:hypothetical protein
MALFDTNSGLGGLFSGMNIFGARPSEALTGILGKDTNELERLKNQSLMSGLLSAGATYFAQPKNQNIGLGAILGKTYLGGMQGAQGSYDTALKGKVDAYNLAKTQKQIEMEGLTDVQKLIKAKNELMPESPTYKSDLAILNASISDKTNPYAKIDPKDYTKDSLARFSVSNNVQDLNPLINPATDKNFAKTNDLRSNFARLPEVQAWNVVQPVLESARVASKDKSGASDLNLIYALGKTLDPNSAVKEGELQLAAGTGSLGDKLKGYYKSASTGGKLDEKVKEDLLRQIESRTYSQKRLYDNTKKLYTSIAKKSGLDPNDIFVDSIVEPIDISADRIANTISVQPQVQNINQGFNLNTPIKSQPKALSDEELKFKYRR